MVRRESLSTSSLPSQNQGKHSTSSWVWSQDHIDAGGDGSSLLCSWARGRKSQRRRGKEASSSTPSLPFGGEPSTLARSRSANLSAYSVLKQAGEVLSRDAGGPRASTEHKERDSSSSHLLPFLPFSTKRADSPSASFFSRPSSDLQCPQCRSSLLLLFFLISFLQKLKLTSSSPSMPFQTRSAQITSWLERWRWPSCARSVRRLSGR